MTFLSLLTIPLIALYFVNPTSAASPVTLPVANSVLHISTVNPDVVPLGSSSPVGGVPFCYSASLGTLLCYPASFLKSAYNFPSTTGRDGLTGAGSTIVIVDAFGSPTLQSDLNKYDSTFGIPPITVTILCGPTWTGSHTDTCPVTTIGDLTTAPNAALCGASGWAEETTLDVTQAHSLAPGAKIVVVVANDCYDSSLYTAELAVVNQHRYSGSIMSQSFGEPDDLVTCTNTDPTGSYCTSYDPTLLNLPNQVFQTAQLNHWTVIASSGDDGANENAPYLSCAVTLTCLALTPSFPATSPLVLAAGGTQGNPYGGQYGPPPGTGGTFTCPAHTNCNTGLVEINGGAHGCTTATRPAEPSSCIPVGYGGESTWNEATVFGAGTASGGGFSSLYGTPLYQLFAPHTYTTLLGVTVRATGRMTPDVSFNSAINGGVLAWLGFLNGGDWAVFGGTSASSPAWAGIIALANQANGQPLGFINPQIYLIGSTSAFTHAFHDITTGNNAICSGYCGEDGYLAGHGYDMTTGWGTPNVANLINALTHH